MDAVRAFFAWLAGSLARLIAPVKHPRAQPARFVFPLVFPFAFAPRDDIIPLPRPPKKNGEIVWPQDTKSE